MKIVLMWHGIIWEYLMGKNLRRNDRYTNYQGHRDYLMGDRFPNGNEGYVVEDLDLLVRGYGLKFNTDSKGRFMLIELKYYPSDIGYAQKKTFGMVDEMLRAGDKVLNGNSPRYLGYFVVQYDNEDWNLSRFWIDGKEVTKSGFDEFISMGYIKDMTVF